MLTTEEMLKKNIGSKMNTLWLTRGCGINQLETERGLQVVLVLIQYSSHVLLDFVLFVFFMFLSSGLQQELKQSQRRCQQVRKKRETELQDLSHAVLSLRVSLLLPEGGKS